MENRDVLVEGVYRIVIRDGVCRRPSSVADGVVGVAVAVRADLCPGEFRSAVVQPFLSKRDGGWRIHRAAEA